MSLTLSTSLMRLTEGWLAVAVIHNWKIEATNLESENEMIALKRTLLEGGDGTVHRKKAAFIFGQGRAVGYGFINRRG